MDLVQWKNQGLFTREMIERLQQKCHEIKLQIEQFEDELERQYLKENRAIFEEDGPKEVEKSQEMTNHINGWELWNNQAGHGEDRSLSRSCHLRLEHQYHQKF